MSGLTAADSDFLHKVGGIINANIAGERLDVGFIADAMCMSHSTLYRKVKAISGMSVAGLIRKYRARKAAELLLTGEYTVSEIALLVGMGSPPTSASASEKSSAPLPRNIFVARKKNSRFCDIAKTVAEQKRPITVVITLYNVSTTAYEIFFTKIHLTARSCTCAFASVYAQDSSTGQVFIDSP